MMALAASSPPTQTQDTALSLAQRIQAGALSAEALTQATLDKIVESDGKFGAFVCTTPQLALETAREVDRRVKAGERLPTLAGVPIAIKDNLNVAGYPTTCSSKILSGYVAPYDATVVARVKAHLMPIVGKTNLDEFAMGSSTENSALQMTRNPWDPQRVPGGSSGGSAACVAANQVLLSLGSDTGGSVRQPAALCGIVGFKPTYGLVSRYGLVAFASSLDQVSPFARNVADAAALLEVIAGADSHDATSLDAPLTRPLLDEDTASGHLKGLRVGVISELSGEGMQPDVVQAFASAQQHLQALGATLVPVSLPGVRYAIAVYYILATAEASANLARFDGIRYGYRDMEADDIVTTFNRSRARGFGPEVKRRIMLGTFSLSAGYYDAYYGKAQKMQARLRQQFAQAWQSVDVMICPTSPTTAFGIGEKASDPVSMYLSDIATIPVNLVGIPGISLPCGFDAQGLPIGLQLLGPHLSEPRLLGVAQAFETASGLANLLPPGC